MHIPRRPHQVADCGVHGHSRSEAVGGPRGTRARLPRFVQDALRPVPVHVLRQVVKELRLRRAATWAPMRQGGSSKAKGPVPVGSRASGVQSVKGVRLGASLSRCRHGLAAVKPRITLRRHRNTAEGTDERMQVALGASLRVAVDVLAGCHDAALIENGCSCERGSGL